MRFPTQGLLPLVLGALLLLTKAAHAASGPTLLLLDSVALAAYKVAYQRGSQPETQQVNVLISKARAALQRGPYTITTKQRLPPSGDTHDYFSQAPYWWPDPTKPGGQPYVQKDGLLNPEVKKLQDGENLTGVCRDVHALALGYYFTGDHRYAVHAARLLRGFFLTPATRMNPHLKYGQGIPGRAEGRSFGIIETRHLVNIPDALALLHGSSARSPELVQGLKHWFAQYTQWLTTSPLGREEGRNRNNHGTFYDVQVVDFALFTGDQALARTTLEAQTLPRVPVQFTPDGSQPLELARTRPWNYVSMNLQGWVQLAELARHVGLDLWHYRTADGRGLQQAIAWFQPYLLKEKQMERPDAVPAGNTTLLLLYHRARPYYPSLQTDQVFALYPEFIRTPWGR